MLILAAVLMLCAFVLVLFLSALTIKLAFAAAAIAVIYPFVKRVFPLPQAWLGVAFGFGILMAYGVVEPLGGLMEQKMEESGKEFLCIKTTLLASMQGYAPSTAIEFGRKVLFSDVRPSFSELEGHVKGKK